MIDFELSSLEAQELAADQQWWRIYKDSFPSSEREPAEVILESIRSGAGLAFRTRLEGRTVGLATTHLLRQPPGVFLVYLAVERRHRNQRLGSVLLEYAWEASAARLRDRGLDPLGMIWEVDPPSDSQAADLQARARRVAFFERWGAFLLGRPYCQPPVDGVTPVPMRLMYRPAEGSKPPRDAVILALIRAIYFEKYATVNGIAANILEGLLSRVAVKGAS